MVGFERAEIKVEKLKEFTELKDTIERAFAAPGVERFLKRLDRKSIRVRDFDGLLAARILEEANEELAKAGGSAWARYQALTLSDQAQMREFYLSKIEEVDEALRHKFKKLYQYY
jgi:hypothetical protein